MGAEWRTNLAELAGRIKRLRCPLFEVGVEFDNIRSSSESVEAMHRTHSTETTSMRYCC